MPQYGFDQTEERVASTFTRPLYRAIIETDAFQRLRQIRFLGAIDYLLHPNGAVANRRHTRYQHTLAVADLALRCARWMRLDESAEQHLVVAALVHDIGHAPLSHSLEPVFKQHFGIGHHEAGRDIVQGAAPIGRSLPAILEAHAVDIDRVLALVEGGSDDPYGFLFAGPVNIDTVEAISRSYTYASANAVVPPPAVVLRSVIRRGPGDIHVLDGFWRLKDEVYRNLINSRMGLLADYVCQHYMRSNLDAFDRSMYFLDERALRRKHRRLFAFLRLARRPSTRHRFRDADLLSLTVTCRERRFEIDPASGLGPPESDGLRYRQRKRTWTTTLRDLLPAVVDAKPPPSSAIQLQMDLSTASAASTSLPNFEACRAYSEGMLNDLRRRLADLLKREDFLVGTNGSFARREASPQSDLDFFVVCDRTEQVDAVRRKVQDITPRIREIVPKAAAADGAFAQVESVESMVANIGGEDDSNKKFTRRMLYLLEGEWLYNRRRFPEIRRALLERYVRETITDHQLALFLLNDIIRYYRTICVDFEFKTAERNKAWGTRNIKLVFSRKLLYFSGILAVAETRYRTPGDKIARLEELFSLPAIDRVRAVCGSRADRALELYDQFLGEFAQETVRRACDATTEADRMTSPVFRRLKNQGHEFSNRLMTLLRETYDPRHPIHRALIL
jgi:predicted nucleotidyltransferase